MFGGTVDCANDMQMMKDKKKEDIICRGCKTEKVGIGSTECLAHGRKFIQYKCCMCCSEALFKCGDTYYCDPCHEMKEKVV